MFDADASHATLRIFDSRRAIAFIGDLSMGQPTDHSLRTAWLGVRLAGAAGLGASACDTVREVSLLRWSGCTANAAGFAQVFGDDIAIRTAMLESRPGMAEAIGGAAASMTQLARIHCEVAGEVAQILGCRRRPKRRCVTFSKHGTAAASRRSSHANTCPPPCRSSRLPAIWKCWVTRMASSASGLIEQRADSRYPSHLVATTLRHAHAWLTELERTSPAEFDIALATSDMQRTTYAELIADIVDLKVPWMTGFSRAVAVTAAGCHARLKADDAGRSLVYQAGLIHGIGRAAVPNDIWNLPTALPASAWEKVRLVPYWTERAGKQSGALRHAALLASHAYERLDGSGYFRGAHAPALTLEARVLAASVAWVALRSPRPWRAAMTDDAAARLLQDEVADGRLCGEAVGVLTSAGSPVARRVSRSASSGAGLSEREIDVLRVISRGASNKEAARELTISLSTVRTHIESVFRKLGCSTRAAATLKASAMGLI